MPRTIYLAIYNSRLFPAHWALWIPHKDDPAIGKRIHANGNASEGFTIDFERNHNIEETTGSYQLLALAEVADKFLEDVRGGGTQGVDQVACDWVEEVALSVQAPGKSLTHVRAEGPRRRVEIQNCQTWLREVVAALVREGVMEEAALRIIDSAPKN
ncbi:hypothetical protein K458DRAFT_420760 [Lentithecium fluviatile CBS 122367]|uniref:Uncharacterized protein n=1 Tax=Lentithecium fluviatile CBS 122367 TaxID=1168545 RepID=A0A6G1ITH2_9PLEO|nr:hypothetical protein K458DRAFT_420760 [Lentithecium fluviatile CBS 122367]